MAQKSFADEVVGHSAQLMTHARRLGRNRDLADDMVQETILRALVHSDQFEPGTNLTAWLHTILRHCYFNEARRLQRFSAVAKGDAPDHDVPVAAQQMWNQELLEIAKLFADLPQPQREALSLVVLGDSYEAAALKAGCPSGTVKSRVSRARTALAKAAGAADQNTIALANEEFFSHDLKHLENAA